MFTLLFLTPVLKFIPSAVLSAVVIAAALTPVSPSEWVRLYRIKEYVDLLLSLVVLVVTLILGPDVGAAIAVSLSIIVVIYRSSRPHFVLVGRLPGTALYKDVLRFPDAVQAPGVLTVRLDGMLSFFTLSHMRNKLDKWEKSASVPIHTILIDGVSISHVDSSGMHLMLEMLDSYQKRNITVVFSDIKGVVRDAFKRSGIDHRVGLENFFLTTQEAIDYVQSAQGRCLSSNFSLNSPPASPTTPTRNPFSRLFRRSEESFP